MRLRDFPSLIKRHPMTMQQCNIKIAPEGLSVWYGNAIKHFFYIPLIDCYWPYARIRNNGSTLASIYTRDRRDSSHNHMA